MGNEKIGCFGGKWKFTKLIGSGSSGQVFEAECVDSDKTYHAAIKKIMIPQTEAEMESLRAGGMTPEGMRDYFRKTAEQVEYGIKMMSALKECPNVVGIEEYEVTPQHNGIGWEIYIRMELLIPLTKKIRYGMTTDEAMKLGTDISKALEAYGGARIIHREVRPENIYVSNSGEYKLGDFGITRALSTTAASQSQKAPNPYLAPEIYTGQAFGTSSDIYSLGLVMYSLMNDNRIPFMPPYPQNVTKTDLDNALRKLINGTDPIPAPPKADQNLAGFIMKACAKNPAARYQNATEMRQSLEFLRGRYSDAQLKKIILEPTLEGVKKNPVVMPPAATQIVADTSASAVAAAAKTSYSAVSTAAPANAPAAAPQNPIGGNAAAPGNAPTAVPQTSVRGNAAAPGNAPAAVPQTPMGGNAAAPGNVPTAAPQTPVRGNAAAPGNVPTAAPQTPVRGNAAAPGNAPAAAPQTPVRGNAAAPANAPTGTLQTPVRGNTAAPGNAPAAAPQTPVRGNGAAPINTSTNSAQIPADSGLSASVSKTTQTQSKKPADSSPAYAPTGTIVQAPKSNIETVSATADQIKYDAAMPTKSQVVQGASNKNVDSAVPAKTSAPHSAGTQTNNSTSFSKESSHLSNAPKKASDHTDTSKKKSKKTGIIIIGIVAAVIIIAAVLLILFSDIFKKPEPKEPVATPTETVNVTPSPTATVEPEDNTPEPTPETVEVAGPWQDEFPAEAYLAGETIEMKTWYRSSPVEVTDEKDNSKGSLCYSETEVRSDWSEWQMQPIEESELLEVEVNELFYYRTRVSWQRNNSDHTVTWTEYGWSNWQPCDADKEAVAGYIELRSETQYRSRELGEVYYYANDWSEWGEEIIQPTDTVIVNTKQMFRVVSGKKEQTTVGMGNFTRDAAETIAFSDVAKTAWYHDNVKAAVSSGIMIPDDYLFFRPSETIKIGDVIAAATMINRIYNAEPAVISTDSNDYGVFLTDAISRGIVNENEFPDLNATATRADVVAIIYRSLPDAEFSRKNVVDSIMDMDSDDPYYKYAKWLAEAGVLSWSQADGNFYPRNSISRAEVATIIDRVIFPEDRVG